MGWDGMGWDGMGWDEMRWDEMDGWIDWMDGMDQRTPIFRMLRQPELLNYLLLESINGFR